MTLELLSTGAFLDAAFWPLRTSEEAAIFIAARSEDAIVWYDASGGTLVPFPPVVAARFGNLVSGKCGTHLALGSEPWIAQT